MGDSNVSDILVIGFWNLEFGIYLVFGACDLELF